MSPFDRAQMTSYSTLTETKSDDTYPGPIWHLILYRHQEIAIQCAFVYFCAAND